MSEGADGYNLTITTNDKAGLIVIVTAIGFSWTVLTVVIRVVSKLHIKRRIGFEESLVITAAILAFTASSCVLAAIKYGLGRKAESRETGERQTMLKLLWVSDVLYVMALAFAKGAVLPLLIQLTPIKKFVTACYALAAFVGCWGLTAALLIGMRCHIGSPWNDISTVQCSSLSERWISVEGVSILIELLLFGMFGGIVYSLKMGLKTKIKVIAAFSTRLPIVVPTILRLIYLQRALDMSTEVVFESTNALIVTQVVLHYTTMAASFAYIKPFLRAFDSNMGATVKVDTIVSTGNFASNRSGDEACSNAQRSGSMQTPHPKRTAASSKRQSDCISSAPTLAPTAAVESCSLPPQAEKQPPRYSLMKQQWNERRLSREKLGSAESMTPIITKTQEWHVHTESRDNGYHAM